MKSVFYWSPILDSVTGQFKKAEVQAGMPAYNFGDVLGIDILQGVTNRRFAYGPIRTADIFVTGTTGQLIEMHGGAKEGAVIAGIGTDPRKETKIDWQTFYDVRLVRGPLTRKRWQLSKDTPLGDPGLLAKEVFGEFDFEHEIGFVRHFKDRTAVPAEVLKAHSAIIIDAGRPPSDVIPEIASCELIVTSSLHGAIVADSYGIPWRRHSAGVGLDLEWNDYQLAVEDRGVSGLREDIQRVLRDI